MRNWESVNLFLKGVQVYSLSVKILERTPESVIVFLSPFWYGFSS